MFYAITTGQTVLMLWESLATARVATTPRWPGRTCPCQATSPCKNLTLTLGDLLQMSLV
jgi:hypothetical protein